MTTRKLLTALCALQLIAAAGCASYDEQLELCRLSVQLVYPEDTIDPYAGARVELTDARASVFADSTNAQGVATFTVPPGIYEATSTNQLIDSTGTTWWRYMFNGVRSMIIVSPDSSNCVSIELKSSRKRIVH